MSEGSNVSYEAPKAELNSENTDNAASTVSYVIAIGLFVLFAGFNVFIASLVGKSGAELVGAVIGTVVGSAIWPIIIVGISSIWKKNRNSRRRVMIFTITVIVLMILQVATFMLVGLYSRTQI